MTKDVEVQEQGEFSAKDYHEPPPAPLIDPEELGKWSFYRALIAEFVATLFFLYVTVLTIIGQSSSTDTTKGAGVTDCDGVGVLGIAWAFGGMTFVLVYTVFAATDPKRNARDSHVPGPDFSRSSLISPPSIAATSSSPKLDSILLLCTSIALSASFFLADVSSASVFVVTSPRKLQSDELATVHLFEENTPSVVYITNLAAKQDAFTLDVLEVPQGSGSGFIWDKEGHIVTNYHVIRAASDLRVTLADQTIYDAKVVGFDQDKDVAVLLVDAPKDKI